MNKWHPFYKTARRNEKKQTEFIIPFIVRHVVLSKVIKTKLFGALMFVIMTNWIVLDYRSPSINEKGALIVNYE